MPSAHPLIDHDDIRRWAEARHAQPSCVRRTGGKGDPGMIRLDFPGFSGRASLSPISWDEWFKAFDDNNLALIVQDKTARGQQSNFNKLVSRESITEGLPPRRERKREQRGASRSTRAVAADRKTTGRRSSRGKTSGRGAPSDRRKSSSRRAAAGNKSSRGTASARGGSSSSRRRASTNRPSSGRSRSHSSDTSRGSKSSSRARRSASSKRASSKRRT